MSTFARQVLAIVQRLRGNAHGAAIRRELLAGDIDASLNAVHVMLDQLEGAGWVTAGVSMESPPKLYVEITLAGEQALIEQELRA